MIVLTSRKALQNYIVSLKRKNCSKGFVPTMGFLHEGHLSLVRRSVKENDVTIVSLFVNPLQFGPREDLRRYPRAPRRDKDLLCQAGATALFMPKAGEFYPDDFQTAVSVSRLSLPLCGKSRPTHFAGVTTVVMKLLNLVLPDRLYLGQKDFQQCRVLEQMIKDMDMPVGVCRAPIIREKDGLAMSSRNAFLSPGERTEAVSLSRSLRRTCELIAEGERSPAKIKKEALAVLSLAHCGRVDYVEIVDSRTLGNVVKLHKGQEVLIAVAVHFSKARLIDNALVRVK